MSMMNLTEYARHRGCYPRAVEVAIANGRIRRDERGLIDSEQADQDWTAGTNPYRSAASKANGAAGQQMRRKLAGRADEAHAEPQETLRKPAGTATSHDSGTTDIAAYARSRAEREHYQAQMAKLAYEQRSGNLIPKDRVERIAKMTYAYLRDTILGVPARIASQLAAESDVARVRDVLEGELRTALESVQQDDLLASAEG